MVLKARTWVDENRGLTTFFIGVLISGIVAFTSVRIMAQDTKDDLKIACQDFKEYRDATARVDAGQTLQLGIIKNELQNLNKNYVKMDKKLDLLLNRSLKMVNRGE